MHRTSISSAGTPTTVPSTPSPPSATPSTATRTNLLPGAASEASAHIFGPHVGLEFEGAASPYGPNDCSYVAQGRSHRPRPGWPIRPLRPPALRRVRETVAQCSSPAPGDMALPSERASITSFRRSSCAIASPSGPSRPTWNTPTSTLAHNTAPTFVNGGVAKITAYRLSSGIVIRLGGATEVVPAAYGCVVQPVTVFPGDPITVTGSVINLEPGKRMKPVYTWAVNGGQIEGNDDTATISTAGLDAGDYTVTGRVSEGIRANQHAECAASFRIQAFDPPTISCSANPSSILPGGISTITSEGRSPQNRPLSYSYTASAGQIGGNGTTGALTTANVSPGTIDITCNVVDDLGKTATSTVTVTVVAPPPPPAPASRSLCSISFDRDRRRPVRVDNEAKGCLDDIALELNRESDATLVVVGNHDPAGVARGVRPALPQRQALPHHGEGHRPQSHRTPHR